MRQTLHRRRFLAMGAGAFAAPFLARGARASSRVAVVELFTSQGCSSCPPADRLLGEMIGNGEAIGLAHHVTYWDYLGWADPLATEAGTRRQYAYANVMGRRGVYTPQAIVNGTTHHVGSRAPSVRGAVAEAGSGLGVRLEAKGDTAAITVDEAQIGEPADIVTMRYRRKSVHAIERGENRGRTYTYHHPVHAIETVGTFDGRAVRLAIRAPDEGIAVLVQERKHGGPGAILGAASLSSMSG